MRPVEDRDLPPPRRMGMHTPQEVMSQFRGGRDLESGDRRALRVQCAEHVIDRAVLAAGVERLKDDEDRMLVLGIEELLLTGELVAKMFGLNLGVRLSLVFALVGRVELAQFQFAARLDHELLAVVHVFSR